MTTAPFASKDLIIHRVSPATTAESWIPATWVTWERNDEGKPPGIQARYAGGIACAADASPDGVTVGDTEPGTDGRSLAAAPPFDPPRVRTNTAETMSTTASTPKLRRRRTTWRRASARPFAVCTTFTVRAGARLQVKTIGRAREEPARIDRGGGVI